MCGIWFYLNNEKIIKDYYQYFMKIKHRGPDSSIYTQINNAYIGFHRLSILETSFNVSSSKSAVTFILKNKPPVA